MDSIPRLAAMAALSLVAAAAGCVNATTSATVEKSTAAGETSIPPEPTPTPPSAASESPIRTADAGTVVGILESSEGDTGDSSGWWLELSRVAGDELPADWDDRVSVDCDGIGPFTIRNLPCGEWRLFAMESSPDRARYAGRIFEVGSAPVDLGTIGVDRFAGIRLRVLGADGLPQDTDAVVATRTRNSVHIVGRGGAMRRGFVAHGSRRPAPPPPDPELKYYSDQSWLRSRSFDPSGGGWREFRCLAPGTTYRVTVRSHPYLFADVVTRDDEDRNGEFSTVELRVPPRLTACALRFTVKGKPPRPGSKFHEGIWFPLELPGDGVVREHLPPGPLALGLVARTEDGRSFELVRGTVEIPDASAFEADVDLR